MTETLLIIGACELSCLGLAFLSWYLIRVRPKSLARRKAILEDSFERLKVISFELLKKVDDFDQSKTFEGKKPDSPNTKELQGLQSISSDSALLSESLETIQILLKSRKLDDANKMLGASVKLVEKINADFDRMQNQTIVLKLESKKKEKL